MSPRIRPTFFAALLVLGLGLISWVAIDRAGEAGPPVDAARPNGPPARKNEDVARLRALNATDVCYATYPEEAAVEPIFLTRLRGLKVGDSFHILSPQPLKGEAEIVDVREALKGGSALANGPQGKIGISFFDVETGGRPAIVLWTQGDAGSFGWDCFSQWDLEQRP